MQNLGKINTDISINELYNWIIRKQWLSLNKHIH